MEIQTRHSLSSILENTREKMGQSLFTNLELSSSARLLQACIDKSHLDPRLAAYIYITTCPKSSEDYLPPKEAASLFFPNKNATRIQHKAEIAALSILGDILNGLGRVVEREKEPKKKTSPVSEMLRLKEISLSVRKEIGIKPQGRIPLDKKPEYDRLMEERKVQ
jgi:hypothetical protein